MASYYTFPHKIVFSWCFYQHGRVLCHGKNIAKENRCFLFPLASLRENMIIIDIDIIKTIIINCLIIIIINIVMMMMIIITFVTIFIFSWNSTLTLYRSLISSAQQHTHNSAFTIRFTITHSSRNFPFARYQLQQYTKLVQLCGYDYSRETLIWLWKL